MIYITGDIHGWEGIGTRLSYSKNKTREKLNENDLLIVLGDFGVVWNGNKADNYWLDWLNNKPFTTLFIDGNHENFNLLNQYPIAKFKGGKVHKIRDNVLHLMRGEIFEIEGKSFFCMGGAESIDKVYRKENISWWKEELPNYRELTNGLESLSECNNKVDYILTHCFIKDFENSIFNRAYDNYLLDYFNDIKINVKYDKWFFGHYHKDLEYDEKHVCVYKKIIRLD
ncbi:metallophosphoesterase [Peptostreptococcus faecalis]|uniref:metallophosphoesterase n=1 Tax=Peptostreptococcus faecalis TaxID=2045015 RepID=UPI000C7D11F1|nr:metallophosphoesterase [Peptostreptococcus faecalis]